MARTLENQADEVGRLQSCINNLIGVLAFPALWSGSESSQLVRTLLDGLLGMLRLDFVYAQFSDTIDVSTAEMVRLAPRGDAAANAEEISRALPRLTLEAPGSPLVAPNPVGAGGGDVSMTWLPLGLQDEAGVLVAGSQRPDFPTQIELLLLRVAANQAAIGLQDARRSRSQSRAISDLEARVTERTRELTDVNEKLVQEIIERTRTEAQVRSLRDALAAELAAMIRLHEFTTRLAGTSELQSLLEEVLTTTIALQNADFGNIQLYNPETHSLEIVAQRGFQQEFLDYFNGVHVGTASYGAALQRGERVIVEDVQTDPIFEEHQHLVAAAGYRAVQSTPMFGRSGEVLGMISTHFRHPHRPSEHELRLTDLYAKQAAEMIERKRADEALRKLNERIELILDSITDNFFGFSKDWRFTFLNTHAAEQMRLLGKDPASLIGKVLWDEFSDVPNEAAVRRVMSERVVVSDELYYAPIGEWVENHMYPSNDGGMVTFQKYVTDRKQAEEALRRSEAYLAEGQRLSHTASWAWSVHSAHLFWSQEHFRILGLDPEAVRPSYELFFEMVHPEDRSAVQRGLEATVEERHDFEQTYRIIRPDGMVRHLHSRAYPVFSESGDLVEYIGTIIDITERKHAEEALARAHAELAHVSRVMTMGELTASIAHEVNQPLAAVVTNAHACERWLSARTPNIREAHQALQRISRDANRASDVIARIRTFLNRGEPSRTEIHIESVIREVVTLMQSELRDKRVSLSVMPVVVLPPVVADRVEIQQVILNLVMNGVEGMSTIATGSRLLRIWADRDPSGAVRVAVRDSGVGLDPGHRDRVFDPFYTTKADGMGMGLAISRSIVESHGGQLWAMANDGPGETFLFTLPCAAPPEQPPSVPTTLV